MTNRQKWELAVAAVSAEYAALAPEHQSWIAEQSTVIRRLKAEMIRMSDEADGVEICANCKGECCVSGKFHVTVIDILVHLSSGRELFSPRFENGLCPYLGDAGCLMPPEYRPYNCVSFNCERIAGLHEALTVSRFTGLESDLRQIYAGFEGRFGNRFMNGLLMNCERDILGEKGTLLRP